MYSLVPFLLIVIKNIPKTQENLLQVYLDSSIWASSIGKNSDGADGNIGYFRAVNSAIALPKVRNAQSF